MTSLSKIHLSAGALLTTLLFTRCNKEEDKIFNAQFYTPQQGITLTLYINGERKGVLPYLSRTPGCDDAASDGPHPFTLQLPSGEYRITGRDDQGTIISSGTMRIRKNRMELSGTTGGMSLDSREDCLAVGVFR